MSYPSYGNIEVVSKGILLKDLSTMKDAVMKIEEIAVDADENEKEIEFINDNGEKCIKNVEFYNGKLYNYNNWRYELDNNVIQALYNGVELIIDLTYDNMPFERIYTKDKPIDGYPVTCYDDMFINNYYTTVTIAGWTNKNVNSMIDLFYLSHNLTSLTLSDFDTSQVTDMSGMFGNCTYVVNLDLSSFDTRKVTNMSSMFSNCFNLGILDISNWDTSSVTNATGIFANCTSLTKIIAYNAKLDNIQSQINSTGATVEK